MELVEIFQPLSKEKVFANIATGECFWEPPPGANVYVEISACLNECLSKLFTCVLSLHYIHILWYILLKR
jgi:hypothetical protein